jgi:hypothetical protein
MVAEVIAFRYEQRSADDRVIATSRLVRDLSAEDVASYIVMLEMRLEGLGHREHFHDHDKESSDETHERA